LPVARFAKLALLPAAAAATAVCATVPAIAGGPQYPVLRVVVDGACGPGTSTHLHGPLQSAPARLKLCGGAAARILDLAHLRWRHWGRSTATAAGIATRTHSTDSPPPSWIAQIKGPVTVTLGGPSDNPRLFAPPETGGPVWMPPRTTYFYTRLFVRYDGPGHRPHTKHLIFQADYPSDTPGDDSASGWQ
jgi:hypothetical protein